jgi:hypothetical protein
MDCPILSFTGDDGTKYPRSFDSPGAFFVPFWDFIGGMGFEPISVAGISHRGLHKADSNRITSYSRILISFYPYASPGHHLSCLFVTQRKISAWQQLL